MKKRIISLIITILTVCMFSSVSTAAATTTYEQYLIDNGKLEDVEKEMNSAFDGLFGDGLAQTTIVENNITINIEWWDKTFETETNAMVEKIRGNFVDYPEQIKQIEEAIGVEGITFNWVYTLNGEEWLRITANNTGTSATFNKNVAKTKETDINKENNSKENNKKGKSFLGKIKDIYNKTYTRFIIAVLAVCLFIIVLIVLLKKKNKKQKAKKEAFADNRLNKKNKQQTTNIRKRKHNNHKTVKDYENYNNHNEDYDEDDYEYEEEYEDYEDCEEDDYYDDKYDDEYDNYDDNDEDKYNDEYDYEYEDEYNTENDEEDLDYEYDEDYDSQYEESTENDDFANYEQNNTQSTGIRRLKSRGVN